MEEIKNFETYFNNIENCVPINEIKLPILKIEEILNNVNSINNDTYKRVLVSFYKTYSEYIDLVNKKIHAYKINDMSSDIMNSSRVVFDVVIFDINDIETIKKNIVNYAMSELYTTLPDTLDIFGIQIKPISFLNKEDLKEVFNQTITLEQTITIISNILNFKAEERFNDFFIFSNKTK